MSNANVGPNPKLLKEILKSLLPDSAYIPWVMLMPPQRTITPITDPEIHTVVAAKMKNSSPGIDEISYNVLQNLPYPAIQALRNIFNKIYGGEVLFSMWKTSVIVPISKTGKNHKVPNGFRLIALS